MSNALRPGYLRVHTKLPVTLTQKSLYGYSSRLPGKKQSTRTSRLRDVLPSASPSRAHLYKWVAGAAAAYLVSAFGGYQYIKSRAVPGEQTSTVVSEDVSDRYDKIAKEFDREVGFMEVTMGIGWLRSWLAKKAFGNVLEVSAGTGRNSKYYNTQKCKTITILDQSQEMVEIARQKFKDDHPRYKACRFVTQSAHDPIVEPPGKFDTILQTMGLCSDANPVQMLRHFGALVNPDGGRILLLEHGRSHYAWLNRILDASAPSHADKYGCWWNKDIGQIVEESGLEVVEMKRYHLGTTWWFELSPRRN